MCLFVILPVLSASAQKFFVKASVGHSVGIDKEILSTSFKCSYVMGLDYLKDEESGINTSFGQGKRIQLAAGYSFTKNATAELGFNYLLCDKVEGSESYLYYNSSDVFKYEYNMFKYPHSIKATHLFPLLSEPPYR